MKNKNQTHKYESRTRQWSPPLSCLTASAFVGFFFFHPSIYIHFHFPIFSRSLGFCSVFPQICRNRMELKQSKMKWIGSDRIRLYQSNNVSSFFGFSTFWVFVSRFLKLSFIFNYIKNVCFNDVPEPEHLLWTILYQNYFLHKPNRFVSRFLCLFGSFFDNNSLFTSHSLQSVSQSIGFIL